MSENDLKIYYVAPNSSVHHAIKVIDKNRDGISLVIDDAGKLVGTITDGDIRRFTLANRSFDEPCSKVMSSNPLTAPIGSAKGDLLSMMNRHRLKSIPLIDEERRPRALIHLRDLISHRSSGHIAVLMAGGEGKRLRPITESLPKPMVKIGDKPILENIIKSLAESTITKIYLAVNYQAKMIEDYFGDGSRFDVQITYLREKEKKGTAGALSLITEMLSEPILVLNGDLVTNVPFSRLLDFHRQHRCVMTVAATEYNINIPYGALKLAEHFVLGIDEKPAQSFLCNAGIYVIDPELLRFIPSERVYNMTDLMNDASREGLPIAAFPVREYWVDVGQKEDLQRARAEAMEK